MQTHTHTHTQHAFVLCSSVQAGCSACVRARGGRKKDVLDIFGSWTPMEDFSIAALRQASLPHPLVNSDDILEWILNGAQNTPSLMKPSMRFGCGMELM